MNKTEARELTLEVWRYLRDHLEIARKQDLPADLWARIKDIEAHCPLCEVLHSECRKCPLGQEEQRTVECNPAYLEWLHAESGEERQRLAGEIVKLVEESRFGEKA